MSRIIENSAAEAGKKAADYFGERLHCAEAVTTAVLEALGETTSEARAHATAFGGGYGKTFCEACGALSGSLIVIGHLHGRRLPGVDWAVPAELGAEIRHLFISEFGTTTCSALRKRFGQEQQMDECRKIVEKTTLLLLDLLGDM
ncbi:C-GCAxxG-C-C family (seleno)protein [Desulfatiferula olefinivorans]